MNVSLPGADSRPARTARRNRYSPHNRNNRQSLPRFPIIPPSIAGGSQRRREERRGGVSWAMPATLATESTASARARVAAGAGTDTSSGKRMAIRMPPSPSKPVNRPMNFTRSPGKNRRHSPGPRSLSSSQIIWNGSGSVRPSAFDQSVCTSGCSESATSQVTSPSESSDGAGGGSPPRAVLRRAAPLDRVLAGAQSARPN